MRTNCRKTVTVIWTRKENSRKRVVTEDSRMRTGANTKEGESQRKTGGWSKMENDKRSVKEEDAGDGDMWRNLVLGEGNPLKSG